MRFYTRLILIASAGVALAGALVLENMSEFQEHDFPTVTYRLLADFPSGNEYVVDHSLTSEDCGRYALARAKAQLDVEFLCQIEE